MQATKLITALTTLTKEEWPSFKKYVGVELTEKSDAYRLFEMIYHQKENLENLGDGEKIRNKKFPNLNKKSFLNLQSKLYGFLEEWFAIAEMKKERFDKELYLLKSHNRRSLYKYADQVAKKLTVKIKSQKLNTESSAAFKKMHHYQYYSNNPIKNREGVELLEKLSREHIQNYHEQSLLYLSELHNYGRIKGCDYDEIKSLLKKSIQGFPPSDLSPTLDLLLELIEQEKLESAVELFDTLKKDTFETPSELHLIVTLYLNYMFTKLRQKGELTDATFNRSLYEYAFENGVFTQNGKISPIRFTNIISVLSNYSSYDEVFSFIDKWFHIVETNHEEETKDLAYAIACVSHHKYEELLYFARHTTYDILDHKLKAQAFYLIAQFHLNDGDLNLFNSLATNFKRSLLRNKNSTSKRTIQGYLNLHDFIIEIVRQKQKGKNIKIKSYKYIIPRSWTEYAVSQLKKQGYQVTLLSIISEKK